MSKGADFASLSRLADSMERPPYFIFTPSQSFTCKELILHRMMTRRLRAETLTTAAYRLRTCIRGLRRF